MRNKFVTSALAYACAATLAVPSFADEHEEEIPFDVAEVFFELNNTDGDLGIHALVDGPPWRRIAIENPKEKKILNVFARGKLRRQGLSEIFFESAEPPFDELPPDVFFARFPEGTYEVEGLTIDSVELESETEITHAMPAPAAPTVNGMPMARQCDDEEPGFDAPTLSLPVIITWPAVDRTHPSLGNPQNSPDIAIVIVLQVLFGIQQRQAKPGFGARDEFTANPEINACCERIGTVVSVISYFDIVKIISHHVG